MCMLSVFLGMGWNSQGLAKSVGSGDTSPGIALCNRHMCLRMSLIIDQAYDVLINFLVFLLRFCKLLLIYFDLVFFNLILEITIFLFLVLQFQKNLLHLDF